MNIFTEIAIAILCAVVVFVILWKVYGALMTPVKCGKGVHLYTVLRAEGSCPEIEQAVDGLLYLTKTGVLHTDIIIADCGMDAETRDIVVLIAKKYGDLQVCREGELNFLLGEIQ